MIVARWMNLQMRRVSDEIDRHVQVHGCDYGCRARQGLLAAWAALRDMSLLPSLDPRMYERSDTDPSEVPDRDRLTDAIKRGQKQGAL